jgi:ABC-2 type transport system ATP-binding protein
MINVLNYTPAVTSESPLRIEKLVKSYDLTKAVDDVSLDLRPGEIFSLLGPNGAGKTSLISCVVGLEEPTSGRISVNGFDISEQPLAAKMTMGVVPQEVVNHGFFDVVEILEFHSGYYGIRNNRERIAYLLRELGLEAHKHKKVRQLSGGMKRRLMIAKALVHEPKLLLLDEPTAGVDIELRESLWNFVLRLKKSGVTILLTTHHLEEAERLCDRVAFIDRGRIKKTGDTKALINELTARRIEITTKDGHQITIPLRPGDDLGRILASRVQNLNEIHDLKIQEGTLEEAFRQVVGQTNGGRRA